jgi:phage terminase large subunit
LAKLRLPYNWKPRPYQLPAWNAWESGIKRSLLVWHRRAGKDEISLHKAAVAGHERVANYWHCLPMYEQARKAIWEAVNPHSGKRRIDEAFPKEIRAGTDNSSMTLEFKTGSIWRVVGSDNPDSLVGAPPAGIVFSEWALCNPSAWGLLQPILLENGGWADFITTPRGKNHVHGMLNMARKNPNWFAEVLTVDDTGQVSEEQLEEVRKSYVSLYGEEAAEALIQQEYYCSFEAAILGAYYGKEMARAAREERIGLVDPDPNYPMHTAWDLGASKTSDSMVVWFWQVLPGRINVVGCYASHGYGIQHYADVIKEYADRVGCQRGDDWVPHDARQIEMGSWEKNPTSPDYGKAKQRIEVMIECGLNPRKVIDHRVEDGIQAVRQLLPRCHFDEDGCGQGIEGLRQYCTEWDDDAKIFKPTPKKDWAAHYADGFRYLAMAYREIEKEQPKQAPRGLVVAGGSPPPGWDMPTYADLLKMQEDEPRARERI